MKQIAIQCAKEQDVKTVLAIMEAAQKAVPESSWFVADDEEFVTRHIKKEGFILLASVEGDMAGYLIVRMPKEAEDNLGRDLEFTKEEWMQVAHMESIAIRPQFQGFGIARRLLQKGEELAGQMGYTRFMATVHPDNLASLHNFEGLDYHVKKTVIKYGGKERLILYKKG